LSRQIGSFAAESVKKRKVCRPIALGSAAIDSETFGGLVSTLHRIFEPIEIGRVTVPNRVVRTAHGTWIARQHINEDLIAYHVARAKGGVGLSYIEYTSVHPSSYSLGPWSWDDSIIPGCRALMAAIRPYEMKMFQQLAHGGFMYPPADGPGWSASRIPNPLTGAVPIPMSRDQIAEVVDAFAQAARRSCEAGLDGVELHAGHGYLLHQFLSPLTNQREDEYGGSLENRMRFLREVLHATRSQVDVGFPIGIRLSDQLSAGGLTPEDCAEIAGMLEAEGLLDFLNGSQGSYHALPAMLPAMERPLGVMLSSSAKVVAGVSRIPRILTAARVRTLEEAEQMLRDGLGDLINLQRAHIADSDLVRKTREGRVEEVRPCIACNQGCVGGLLSPAARLGCAVNPAVGFERTLSEDLISKSGDPKRVLVVGGGPAGMEAARVAAIAGHRVTLVEASAKLGGTVNVARLAPKMHSFGDITTWLESEIMRLGVEIRIGTYMEADDVLAEKPEVVIVATGGIPRLDGMQTAIPGMPARGVDQPHVITSTDLLTDRSRKIGATAVVFDDVGHYEAVAAADVLVERGAAVTFVTRCSMFAPTVETWTRTEPALERLNAGQFRVLTRMHLIEIRSEDCIVRPLQGERIEVVPAETVVLVLAREPLSSLADELRGAIADIRVVGDALAPRDLQAAIREGHLAARSIQ
jgi:2,4-dienoyl-CoA reductase-like NADH-dependent reductase (Old Yellow Enzyme family)